MTQTRRVITCALAMLALLSGIGCVDEGIGSTVPSSGARWTGAGGGPDVFVGGGPVR
jgi:hypothetical protein